MTGVQTCALPIYQVKILRITQRDDPEGVKRRVTVWTDYTRKAEFTLINELAADNKLPNICTVINGLDLQKNKYGYYYGYGKYGKYYGYGKRYGYGYGYGEHKIKEE